MLRNFSVYRVLVGVSATLFTESRFSMAVLFLRYEQGECPEA
jgi:hypothetical protein